MDADFVYLTQNPRLFRAALEFNNFYLPPDFGLPDQEAETLRLKTALTAKQRLWRHFPRERTDVWCFAVAVNRLALLPLNVLKALAVFWSAVVWAEALARTVEGDRLQQIKAVIGAEAFRYAVRQGRFQLGGLRKDWLPADVEMLSEQGLPTPGKKLLFLALSLWPEILREAWLARWRFTPEAKAFSLPIMGEEKEAGEKDLALLQKTWPHIEKLLFTEVAPEWQPCFSS